jgi:regulatory protein
MPRPTDRKKPAPPLEGAKLRALALHYVGRYATTQGKLRAYLDRKIRERGWSGPSAPDLAGLTRDFAELGYVNDAGFAESRAASLARRGYGPARIRANLKAAGIDDDLVRASSASDHDAQFLTALAFARKRRLGPFSVNGSDRAMRQRAFAAMIRAGHDFEIAGKVLALDLETATKTLDG